MKTIKIIANGGVVKEVIADLKVGDVLICHTTKLSESGLGFWSTTRYDSFLSGKEYKVHTVENWLGGLVGRVIDEDGSSCFATPEVFEKKKQ